MVFLISLFFLQKLYADDFLDLCPKSTQIIATICSDNKNYIAPANRCFLSYKNNTKKLQESAKLLSLAGNQVDQYQTSSSNFSSGIATLTTMQTWNRKLDQLLKSYLASFVQPIDNRNPLSRPCYGNPHQKISEMRKVLAEDFTNFEQTLVQLKKMESQTTANKEKIKAIHQNPKIIMTDQSKSTPTPKGKTYRSSDISGTEDKPKSP